jgi:hypothetical protein
MSENSNQDQVKSEKEKKESKNPRFAVPQAAIEKLADLVKMIPRDLAGSEQAILWVLIAVGIIMLGFAVVIGVSNNTIPLLVLFGLGMFFFFLAMTYFLGKRQISKNKYFNEYLKKLSEKNESLRIKIQEKETTAAQELEKKGNIAWKREVIKLPLPDDNERRDIVKDLVDIRNAAFSWLNDRHPDLKISQIRANIFLAKYEEADKGVVCMLRMPEYFRLGMSGHTDEEIAFRPGEGATGKAFVEHDNEPAIFDDIARTWEERYILTEYQKRKIHKKLRWIITYPLKNKNGEAMAVLNLDCLGLKSNKDELKLLKAHLQQRIERIEAKFNEFYDKVRISINVEPVS